MDYEGFSNQSTWFLAFCLDNSQELHTFKNQWFKEHGCNRASVKSLHETLMWNKCLMRLYRAEFKRFKSEGGEFDVNVVNWAELAEHWAANVTSI